MNKRTLVFLLMAALMLHQIFAGTFMSGTVLCFGCVRSDTSTAFVVLPAEWATCTNKGVSFLQDRCCREKTDSTTESTHGELMAEELCQQCIGYALSVVPSIPPIHRDMSSTVSVSRIAVARTWWFGQEQFCSCHPPRYLTTMNAPTLDCLASVVIRC